MENLFNFEYSQQVIKNLDGTDSRFGVVFGDKGKVIHTKKDTYSVIPTNDLSKIGNVFIDKGFEVKTFSHRDGEVIGLNINLGQRQSNIGDKTFNAIITVPNNGGGKGYISIKETRLICKNGMVRTLSSHKSQIKIPHTVDYPFALKVMQDSIEQFEVIIQSIEESSDKLDGIKMTKTNAMFELNKWFFEQEMPLDHKKDMDLNKFRALIFESPEEIKCIDRYNELKASFERELTYNEQLGLDLSMYTVFATVTNYLSRRIEKSQSTAPTEIQYQRQSEKLLYFAK